jgi:hypothetical protein
MEPKAQKSPVSVVREIKRQTRRQFNSEEKIRIILEGLRGFHRSSIIRHLHAAVASYFFARLAQRITNPCSHYKFIISYFLLATCNLIVIVNHTSSCNV